MSTEVHGSAAKTYGKVLGVLVTLTVVTVLAAGIDFGSGNVVIALVIATIKASLVALFFMHLLHEKAMNSIIFLSGLVFLAIFLTLTALDTDTRDVIRPSRPPRADPPAAAVTPQQP